MKLDGAHPKWTQCPKCQDVMHQSCFDRWVLNGSGSDSLQFSCPSCRYAFDRSEYESNPDSWSAADVQSTLAEEANESDDDRNDRQNDAENESCGSGDDSDDSDELKEPPAKRVTRHSQGVAKTPDARTPDARSLRRLTRSRD